MRKHLELLLIIKRLSSLLKHGFKLTIPRIEEEIKNCLPYITVYLWTHIILFLGPSAFLLMIYLFLATKYWWIPVGYATWLYYDRKFDHKFSKTKLTLPWTTYYCISIIGWNCAPYENYEQGAVACFWSCDFFSIHRSFYTFTQAVCLLLDS